MLIVDTAGRLHVDEELMDELARIRKRTKPHDVLLVVDAMTGQDAVGVAESFAEAAEFDGVVMTKLDGDARGGAALSVKAVTGKPILFASTGEKLEAFERFHPDRMASRILGMGDVLSLIEKAEQQVDEDEAEDLQRKLETEQFTLEDFLKQMRQVRKMGPISGLLGMMPGMGAMKQLKNADVDEGELDRVEAIILSMTPGERADPALDQRLAAQTDRQRLGDQGPARQPAGQAVRPDAHDDEADGDRQAARPRSRLAHNAGVARAATRRSASLRGRLSVPCPRPMAVRIRLRRVGSKKNPIWRIVVADKRSPRDGRTIETIGQYNPQTEPSTIVLDEERAKHWLEHGAQPSETVATLLRTKGIAASGS